MSIETDKKFHLDNLKEYEKLNAFISYNHIEIVELTEDHSILRHTVDENSVNINGNAHGGILMTMMDAAAGVLVRKNGSNCATSTVTSNFFKPGHGTVYCRGEFLKRGRRINVIHSWCYNEDGTIIADSTVNMCQVD